MGAGHGVRLAQSNCGSVPSVESEPADPSELHHVPIAIIDDRIAGCEKRSCSDNQNGCTAKTIVSIFIQSIVALCGMHCKARTVQSSCLKGWFGMQLGTLECQKNS